MDRFLAPRLTRSVSRVLLVMGFFAAGAWTTGGPAWADRPALKSGDRIVFLGDSITQSGAGPNGYVTLVRKVITEQFPDLKVEIIGAGISGNRVPDLQARLDRDVIARKPTLVVIYIGINDVWHLAKGRGTTTEVYERGLRDVVQRIQDAGARVIVATPSVIGEKNDGSNPLDATLDAYAAISRKVASDREAPLLDLRRQFVEYLKKNNPKNAANNILTTDGIHLNTAGNRFVADRMLYALGLKKPQANQK